MSNSRVMESEPFNFPRSILCRVLKRIHYGSITVFFPNGSEETFSGAEPGPQVCIQVINYRCLWRVILGGDLGLAEGYIAGDWDSDNIGDLLKLGILNRDALIGLLSKSWIKLILSRIFHVMRSNTRRGSRRNISQHYDLGNDFYSLWLDQTMTYSSALFDTGEESILQAQQNKYRRMASQLDLKKGDNVLDIGCGWGGFAKFAAEEFGCRVTGITLSKEQAMYASSLIARTGLTDQIRIRIQDYRDCTGSFDKIVSSEMFEAVGIKNWSLYCGILRKNLNVNGLICLQIISIDEKNVRYYRKNPDFIQRYIFHGGVLPSPKEIENSLIRSNLKIIDSFYFGESYARTLKNWREEFQKNWLSIKNIGFDEQFYRMWNYYLCYCEAGFEMGNINVGQYTIRTA